MRCGGGGLWRACSGADDFYGAAVEGEDVYAGHGEGYVGGCAGVEGEACYGAQFHQAAARAADAERAVGRDPCGAAVIVGWGMACAVLTEEGGEEGVARDGERQRVVREREAVVVLPSGEGVALTGCGCECGGSAFGVASRAGDRTHRAVAEEGDGEGVGRGGGEVGCQHGVSGHGYVTRVGGYAVAPEGETVAGEGRGGYGDGFAVAGVGRRGRDRAHSAVEGADGDAVLELWVKVEVCGQGGVGRECYAAVLLSRAVAPAGEAITARGVGCDVWAVAIAVDARACDAAHEGVGGEDGDGQEVAGLDA